MGFNLSHDSSIAITDLSGKLIFAVQEERLNREKNTVRFPQLAIADAFRFLNERRPLITSVHFGSKTPFEEPKRIIQGMEFVGDTPSFTGQAGYSYPPGKRMSELDSIQDKKSWFQQLILENVSRNGFLAENTKFYFEDHQDSHVSSGFFASGFDRSLAISLDGHGDGKSGRIYSFENRTKRILLGEISDLDSFGHLYAAVTSRYNFRPLRHEGKITGLAAYGQSTLAAKYLLQNIEIKEGLPKFNLARSRTARLILRGMSEFGLSTKKSKDIFELIERTESKTSSYEELAFVVQDILEKSVIEIVNHWLRISQQKRVTLAGGVFANVKLNQRIREMHGMEDLFVFPAMSDTGVAAGSIWNSLHRSSYPLEDVFSDVFLGSESANLELGASGATYQVEVPENELVNEITKQLVDGKLVGIVVGRMEYGPRALGNRTLLIDPRNHDINSSVNRRLNRTEFMPFAPICLEEDFRELFEIKEPFQNFKFMTETCVVKDKWKSVFPAAIHIDGTARPQVLCDESNPFLKQLLLKFKAETGCPVLINTSLNVHEEPIVSDISQAIRSLADKKIDFVTDGKALFASR